MRKEERPYTLFLGDPRLLHPLIEPEAGVAINPMPAFRLLPTLAQLRGSAPTALHSVSGCSEHSTQPPKEMAPIAPHPVARTPTAPSPSTHHAWEPGEAPGPAKKAGFKVVGYFFQSHLAAAMHGVAEALIAAACGLGTTILCHFEVQSTGDQL